MENPFQIQFKNIFEVRHGSPYNVAELIIEDNFPFKINFKDSWQDIYSWSRNKNALALIKWDLYKNEPGFKIITFDLLNYKYYQSNRLLGCCNKIAVRNNLNSIFERYSSDKNRKYSVKRGENKIDDNFKIQI